MSFKVAARTILELGAELISSDAIALYELIKNAYDARSKRVTIDIRSIFKFSDFRNALKRIAAAQQTVDRTEADERDLIPILVKEILLRIDQTADDDDIETFKMEIAGARTLADLRSRLTSLFERLNVIDVIDTGDGMSLEKMNDVFLTVGTTSRFADNSQHYVGGKGIGRLSAMRLGDLLEVRSATHSDTHWNILQIDWRVFTHASALELNQINVKAVQGSRKSDPLRKGTRIRIRSVKADWDKDRLKKLADNYFDRLFDPFGRHSRFPVIIKVNDITVPIATFDSEVFVEAQAKADISYTIAEGEPRLVLDIDYQARGRTKIEVWTRDDLLGITAAEDISVAALETLGPFTASFHWFNRQRLKGIEGFGDREKVKDVVNKWANGLLMYRDGFRVNPYGDPLDDWLGIDVKALASSGYKVNRKQLVGAVYISAEHNPLLIDQTNREGLRANEERTLLVTLLRAAITEKFKTFLNQVDKELRKAARVNATETAAYLESVASKMRRTLKNLIEAVPKDRRADVQFVEQTFDDLHLRLDEARLAIDAAERDQRDMVDLAGVGLQVEIVAHELGRVTRRTLELLGGLNRSELPSRVNATFEAIESQMVVIRKRLDVLDPLGPNSRNRKVKLNLKELVEQVIDSHQDQFARYNIRSAINVVPPNARSFEVNAVRGMLVQVIENLLDNSVFWIRQRQRVNPGFAGEITIDVDIAAGELRISDNGPGIAVERSEEIFLPFVTFKPPGEGKGLGLFISREIAKRHAGDLYLLKDPDADGKLHTFVLDLNG
ncbi:MAG: sensor histidine kinase [Agrobacterium cavarae]|uniref:sensor histidine kinase n=1 Tax=Agrobacterium cavarae TaxID=2528239 RepID=UPI0031AC4C7B